MKSVAMLILVSVAILTGCGSSGGGGNAGPSSNTSSQSTNKNLFSDWKRTTDSADFNFSGGQMGQPMPVYFGLEGTSSICECNMTFTGTGSQGIWTNVGCFLFSGPITSCNQLDNSGTYSISGDSLTICGQKCGTFN